MERFRHCAGLAEGGDEVDVAEPSREDVHVKMSGNARTGGFAEVHSDVEAFRVIDLLERGLRSFCQVHHFVGDLFVGFVDLGDVIEWQDHQVSRAVRINIEDDKIKLGPTEDKFFLVAGRAFQDVAEDASARFCGPASGYVVISPRAP